MATEYQSKIKKKILKSFMFDMYPDAKTIFREYIQNAMDSIYEAVETGILSQKKDGYVNVQLDKSENKITITDNGTGISCSIAESTLLDISSNNKDGVHQAGLFGIGRLVGGGFCNKLVFFTSCQGENLATKVEFDMILARELFESEVDYTASEMISQIATTSFFEEEESKHYFVVVLSDVLQEYSDLLDSKIISEYLESVAPIEFRDEFDNNIIYSSTIDDDNFKNKMDSIKTVPVIINGKRIQKRYGLKVVGTGDDIQGIKLFEIKDPTFGQLAWGWYALTRYTIQIPQSDAMAEIRLRKHNIQIGENNLLSGRGLWPEERGNSYFYGEIHITHDMLYPNSARDDLADTTVKRAFVCQLKSYFLELSKLYKKANEAKNCIKSIQEGIDIVRKKHEFSDVAKDKINNKGIDKFQKLWNSNSSGPIHNVLELYKGEWEGAQKKAKMVVEEETSQRPKGGEKPKIESAEHSGESNTNPSSEGKSSSSISETRQFQSGSSPSSVSNEGLGDYSQTVPAEKPTTASTQLIPLVPTQDLLKSLEGVLSTGEIWLVRRIFRSINLNCPQNEHDRALIEQLKKLVVKDLINDLKTTK